MKFFGLLQSSRYKRVNLPQAKPNLEMIKSLWVVVALTINLDPFHLALTFAHHDDLFVRIRVPPNFDQLNWS